MQKSSLAHLAQEKSSNAEMKRDERREGETHRGALSREKIGPDLNGIKLSPK